LEEVVIFPFNIPELLPPPQDQEQEQIPQYSPYSSLLKQAQNNYLFYDETTIDKSNDKPRSFTRKPSFIRKLLQEKNQWRDVYSRSDSEEFLEKNFDENSSPESLINDASTAYCSQEYSLPSPYEAEYSSSYPVFLEKDFYDYCPISSPDHESEIEFEDYEQQYYQHHNELELEKNITQEEEMNIESSDNINNYQTGHLLMPSLLQALSSKSNLRSLSIFCSLGSQENLSKPSHKNYLEVVTEQLLGFEHIEKLELHTSEGYDIMSMRRMLESMMMLKSFEFHFYGSEKKFRWDIGFPFNDLYGLFEVKIKIHKGVKYMPWDIRFAQGLGKLQTLENLEIVDETDNVMGKDIFQTMEAELSNIKSLRSVFLRMKIEKESNRSIEALCASISTMNV